MRTAGLQLATYAGLVVLTVVGVMALSVSYRRNAEYLADMEREVARLRAVPAARSVTSVQGLLPRLDAIRAVVTSANRYNDSVPWGMRWGLYQGRAMGNAARDAYLLELDASLLDFVAARLQQRLVQYGGEPEKLYEYLKAYLMLGQPEHMNEKHLQYLVNLEWSPANGVPDAVGTSLTQHFQALLDSDDRLRPVPINASLVSQACSTVRRASMGRIMYSWLRETYASNDSQGVRLDVAGGVAATQVITRKSGVSLSQPLPSLFSRGAFEKITGSDLPELVDEFAKDNWVCDGGSDLGDRTRLQGELTNIYQQEYIAAWDGVVNDLDDRDAVHRGRHGRSPRCPRRPDVAAEEPPGCHHREYPAGPACQGRGAGRHRHPCQGQVVRRSRHDDVQAGAGGALRRRRRARW